MKADIIEYRNNVIKEIERRKITRLCHATPLSNVYNILSSDVGIIASSYLNIDEAKISDYDRVDFHKDYVACSIEYPNHFYMNSKGGEESWVVFLIDPIEAARKTSMYSCSNAAKKMGKMINGADENFYDIFSNRDGKALTCIATDEQAEVLIYKNIPKDKIKGVVFSSLPVLKEVRKCLVERGIGYPDLFLCADMFDGSAFSKAQHGTRVKEHLIFNSRIVEYVTNKPSDEVEKCEKFGRSSASENLLKIRKGLFVKIEDLNDHSIYIKRIVGNHAEYRFNRMFFLGGSQGRSMLEETVSDASYEEDCINENSILGKALLGHKKGDVVSYINLDKEEERYKIRGISTDGKTWK